MPAKENNSPSKDHTKMTNIEILADILKTAQNIPFSSKPDSANQNSKLTNRPTTSNGSATHFAKTIHPTDQETIGELDFNPIDDFELEQLQHRILSQNIKQGIKKVKSSAVIHREQKPKPEENIATFFDFKNFVHPSSSAVDFHPKGKLLKSPQGERTLETRFLNQLNESRLKDVKTYKDFDTDKHMGPLEINYKYKTESFYKQKPSNIPTTASQSHNQRKKVNFSRASAKTSQGFRVKPNSRGKKNPDSEQNLQPMQSILRASSTGNLVESIPTKKSNNFPKDFCIENTLVCNSAN